MAFEQEFLLARALRHPPTHVHTGNRFRMSLGLWRALMRSSRVVHAFLLLDSIRGCPAMETKTENGLMPHPHAT
jgi:hypothetical protein